ncbi:peptidyl-tRNA hydrolase AgPth2_2 [Andalucia godoyi]|uniref:peptidyl-tRNA hydrolase n=1 Tax=Andalucia godoyi TaxID=505711 RepID=A0A8K0AI27_ANDGO|nr:peptidyl-tRNA hydrolase AgPth2_2 [Andalucia godoyi]|eukprot:ANDGO_01575.mRNA.1 peptidyl-tRNA hydrolase AgPth2_2
MENEACPTLYILVNGDIELSKGKIANQVSHLTMQIAEEMFTRQYEVFPPAEIDVKFATWIKNQVTIVLRSSADQLIEWAASHPHARSYFESDIGRRIPEGTLTALAFLPGSISKRELHNYKLL